MKISVIPLALAIVSIPAWPAEEAVPVVDGLVDCAAIQDTRTRLACFDELAAPFVRPRVAVATPAPSTGNPGAASFGKEQLGAKDRPAAQQLHGRIASQRAQPPDAYVVTLDNGQSWRHENAHQAAFLRDGDAVTITQGALGTYRLTRDAGDAKNWIRVTRIR